MYVSVSNCLGRKPCVLLRESYREEGKVKHRTIANLSHCSPEEIEAIKLALQHKADLVQVASIRDVLSLRQGGSVGALLVLKTLAERIGLAQALGASREGKLALWQVCARIMEQGSRLSAVRLAEHHAVCDLLEVGPFTEDHLYANLAWLSSHQESIENALFARRQAAGKPELFLYDVTSSYFEGRQNELAAFGYNRDGKKGKPQIVVGLLCDEHGEPLSIEVFEGNCQDTRTMASQIKKVAERFGGGSITFVGDRGMIKQHQIDELKTAGCHYITAITKPQIEGLLKQGVLQMELFDEDLAEVDDVAGIRYILRRNPVRMQEARATRESKVSSLRQAIQKWEQHLRVHPKAKVETAIKALAKKLKKYRLDGWLKVEAVGRELRLKEDEEARQEEEKLDGCYVLKTDLPSALMGKEAVHARYKDLALVERAFRSCKTSHLEMRPIFVRKEAHTRGHALVIMLAYRLTRELERLWIDQDLTVREGLGQLATLCATEVLVQGKPLYLAIPEPNERVAALLKAAEVVLPRSIRASGGKVATRKKLPTRRQRLRERVSGKFS